MYGTYQTSSLKNCASSTAYHCCLFLVFEHAKKEFGQYPAILTSHLVNNHNTLTWLRGFQDKLGDFLCLQVLLVIVRQQKLKNCKFDPKAWDPC